MKRLVLGLLIFLFLAGNLQGQTLSFGFPLNSLDASSGGATTNGTAFALMGNPASVITWTTIYSSTPTAITVNIQISMDNSTFYTVATTSSTSNSTGTFVSAAKFIRGQISAKTGSFNTTVTLIAKAQPTSSAGLFSGGTVTGTITMASGSIVVNDPGTVGIGQIPNSFPLTVTREGSGGYYGSATYRSSAFAGGFVLGHARGTIAVPAVLNNNDRIASLFFKSWDATATDVLEQVSNAVCIEAFSGTPVAGSTPGYLVIGTTPDAGNTCVQRWRFEKDGNLQTHADSGGNIGASETTFRPSNGYFSTSLNAPIFQSPNQKVLLKGTGTGPSQLALAQTTVPTCTTNCGSGSPLVSGTDTAGIITLGTTPASGFVVVFNGTWAAAPSCIVQMALAGMVVGKMPLTVVATTTQFTVVTNGTAPASADKYQFHCIGIQ